MLPTIPTHRVASLLLAASLGLYPVVLPAQGWDDVGFWAADYTLNVLQNRSTGKLVNEYAEVYTVLKDGYFVVRALVDENHSLHEEFFAELATVNPVVTNYYKVGLIVKLYTEEFRTIRRDVPQIVQALKGLDVFDEQEIGTIETVIYRMIKTMGSQVDELILIALPGEGDLSMMDSERIEAIDRIYLESQAVMADLRDFRRLILQLATNRDPAGARQISQLYGPQP